MSELVVTGDAQIWCRSWSCRLYSGPEYYGFLTLFFLVGMSAIFNVFTAPFFFRESRGVLGALAVIWLCTLVCVCALLSLIFRDPGIVPKSVFFREHLNPVKGQYREKAPPMVIEIPTRTFPVRCKYCEACGVYRAPRVTHCSACDCCMERFDHHCPWLGTCVGRRNYSIFLVFMFSLTISTLGMIGVGIAHLALYTLDQYTNDSLNTAIQTTLRDNIPVAILVGIGVLFMWFIVGLFAYHCYLAANAMTTYEHIRGAFDVLGNPYDSGSWIKNICKIFALENRPSWVDLKSRTTHIPIRLESEVCEPALPIVHNLSSSMALEKPAGPE